MMIVEFENQLRRLQATDITEKRAIGGEYTLSFRMMSTDESYELVRGRALITHNNEKFRVVNFDEQTIGNKRIKQVACLHTFFDLKGKYVYTTLSGTLTLQKALDHVFAGTDYVASIADTFSSVEFENFGDDNALSLFNTILKRYGAEYELVGNVVHLKRNIGAMRAVQVRYKHNLADIKVSEDWSEFATKIRGFGKEITAEYVSQMATRFGVIEQKPVNDERYTVVSALQERLVSDLKDAPSLNINVSTSYQTDLEQLQLGDKLFLIHEALDIKYLVRVMSLTRYPDSKKATSFELATVTNLSNSTRLRIGDDVQYAFKDKTTMTKTSHATKRNVDAIAEDGKVIFQALPASVGSSATAVNDLFSVLDFSSTHGLIARDPDNFMRFVCFKRTGIYSTTDGGLNLEQVIGPEGLMSALDFVKYDEVVTMLLDYVTHEALLEALSGYLTTETALDFVKYDAERDVVFADNLSGVVLTDSVTNKKQRITCENGTIKLVEVL